VWGTPSEHKTGTHKSVLTQTSGEAL